MQDWPTRCRRLVEEVRAADLLPEGTSAEALVDRLLREAKGLRNDADDLWLLLSISPRLTYVAESECIYEDSSYAEFAAPFAKLAEETIGPVEIQSRLDGHAEKAYLTFKARDREHSCVLEQSTDWADIGGVLA